MGCCINKYTPTDSMVVIRPLTVDQTEADEEHYSPTPPRSSRDKLIPDCSVFMRIDQHAKCVPREFRNSIKDLASYLRRPCTTDVEITRAFYIWICHNISFDVSKTRPNDPESVIKSGSAVCQGYSDVFASLCRISGIKVKVITGYTKGAAYNVEKPFTFDDRTDHAWNAVYIQDEWRFVECTLGSGGILNGVYVRNVRDIYFLIDPHLMINVHFPYMNYNERKSQKWQLLNRTKSLSEYNSEVQLDPDGLEWDVRISPNKAVLGVNNKTEIVMKATRKQLVDVLANLYCNDVKVQGSFFIEHINPGTFKCTFRPRETGRYKLMFFGIVSNDEKSFSPIFTISLNVLSVQKNIQPYPDLATSYGCNGVLEHGLKESMKYGQIFLRNFGTLDIPIEKDKGVRLTYELKHSKEPLVDGQKYIFRESNNDTTAIFHLRLPFIGFYQFKIFSKLPKETGTLFSLAASCLVECVKPTALGYFPEAYAAADELSCRLMKPLIRDLTAKTTVQFEISCHNLVIAELQSGTGESIFPLKQKGHLWCGSVKIPSAGQELVIFGNNISSKLRGLFKFQSV